MVAVQQDDSDEGFIRRWAASEGAERANFQLFASELCALLDLPPPEPFVSDAQRNPYAFERAVDFNRDRAPRIALSRR